MQHVERQGKWCCLKWRSNREDLRATRSFMCGGNTYKAGKQDYKGLVIPKDQKVYLQRACHLKEYLHNTRNQTNIIQGRESSHARRYSKVFANRWWTPEEEDTLSRTKILCLLAHRMPIQSQHEKIKKKKSNPETSQMEDFYFTWKKMEKFPQVRTLPGYWEKGLARLSDGAGIITVLMHFCLGKACHKSVACCWNKKHCACFTSHKETKTRKMVFTGNPELWTEDT